MLFIIEQTPRAGHVSGDVIIQGSKKQLKAFQLNVAALAVEAAAQKIINVKAVESITSGPTGLYPSFDALAMKGLGLIAQANSEQLLIDRQSRVAQAVVAGSLSVNSYVTETSRLHKTEFDLDSRHGYNIKHAWVAHTGIGCVVNDDGRLRPDIYEKGTNPFAKSHDKEIDTISQLTSMPLTVSAWQYELIAHAFSPRVQSNREHESYGVIDDTGNYQPVVTILNLEHPAATA